ncbi:MAG: hypothetical protein SFV55_04785 [Haliscomenobacter sp.]|uniref:hypothetical protein n=1 Tax=Haliscomenobacter sp. TaxID=2717303 RepID=UPI0029B755C5|nr:hypothetical protein [Haliscomenobacter sp.]MDX2067718.1 hypothetical protein [Haliscomenobacter sp.]
MRTFLLLLLCLVLWKPLPAQSEFKNQVSLYLGLQQHLVADRQASPLHYQGILPAIGLDFSHKQKRGLFQIEATVAGGAFDASAYSGRTVDYGEVEVHLEGKILRGGIAFRYLRRVQKSHSLRTYLGLGLQQRIDYPGAEPYVGLIALSSIPLVARIEKNGPRNQLLYAQLGYALGGVFTRLPWWHTSIALPGESSQFNAFYRNNTQWVWGTQLAALDFRMGYQHQLGLRWRVGAQYDMSFLQHSKPQQLQIFNQHLKLQFTRLF